MARTLYLFAVRDYPSERTAFTDVITKQIIVAQEWWANPNLGDRALTAVIPEPLKTRRDIENAVHDAGLHDLTDDDVAVVYITGHGTRTPSGRHYLLLPDTPHGHHLAHGYPTAAIVSAALASRAKHVLVIVNSCFAGELHAELAQLRKDLPDGRRTDSLAVITTADFDQMPRADEFATVLADTYRWLTKQAGYITPLLSVDTFLRELRATRRRLAHSGITVLDCANVWLGPTDADNPCLPNPGYRRPPEKAAGGGLRQLASTTAELGYWLDRASGRTTTDDPGWYFTGRHILTTRIAEFLDTDTGMLIVTGAAGTGKSALIARTVTLSDPGFRADLRYTHAVATAPPDTVPAAGSIDLAILARNKTVDQILTQFLTAAGGTPSQSTDATSRTAELRAQFIAALPAERTVTAVIDGLDEATRPASVITEVIGPLLHHPHIRLIIGVRSSTPDHPDIVPEHGLLEILHRFRDTVPVHTIRTDGPDTVADIVGYLRALLATATGTSLADTALPGIVAELVAPSFLDARFAGERLRSQPHPPHPDDPDLHATLRDGTIGLLRDDLTDIATPDHPVAVLLATLRATAFARGAGIPWADIWPAVATAIRGSTISDAAIAYVLESRLSGYLTHDTEDHRTVYRPVHESLTDVLVTEPHRLDRHHPTAEPQEHQHIHTQITEQLRALLPEPGEPPHPYIRRHLVDHATTGRILTDHHIPAHLLPWETGGRIRAGLGLPVVEQPDTTTLAAWASIEAYITNTPPPSRALSLDFALTAAGHPTNRIHPPGLRPRWAHWRTTNNNILCHLPNTTIKALAVVPGPQPIIATATITFDTHTYAHDHAIRLWDPGTGSPVGDPLTGHDDVTALAAVSLADGRTLLASGSSRGTIRLWDPATGSPVGDPLTGHDDVTALAAVPLADGRTLLASGNFHGTIRLWDPTTSSPVGEPPTDRADARITAMVATSLPDGRTLVASGNTGGRVWLWDAATGRPVGEPIAGHNSDVLAAAVVPLPDGRSLIATGSTDGRVRLLDPLTGSPVGASLTGHTGPVNAIAAVSLPNGRTLLASGGHDRRVRLWDPATGRPFGNPISGHTGPVKAIAAVSLPDDRTLLATDGSDNTVRLWDPVVDSSSRDRLAGHVGGVRAVAAVSLPDGRTLLAASGTDEKVRLWDPTTGSQAGIPLVGHAGAVRAIASVSLPDGRTVLASGGDDRTVRLWDSMTGSPVLDLQLDDKVLALAMFSMPDNRTMLAAGDDRGRMRFYDPTTGSPVGNPLGGHLYSTRDRSHDPANAVTAIPLPDGGILLASDGKDEVRLWNPATGKQVGHLFTKHIGPIVTAVSLPDGGILLASGGKGGTIRLWNPTTGKQVGDLFTGNKGWVNAMTPVSLPDNTILLASGGEDGTVRLWDVSERREVVTIVARQPVYALCTVYHGDDHKSGCYLAIAGLAGIGLIDCTRTPN